MTTKGFAIKGTAKVQGVVRSLNKVASGLGKNKKAAAVLNGALERIGHTLTDFAMQAPAAMLQFGKAQIDAAREADQLAKKVGGSVNEIQALIAAGKALRIDADNTSEAIKTFQENLGELARLGTGPAKDSLGSLGLTLNDFANLGVEDRLKVFAKALGDLEDPTKQLSIAIEVMGEDGAKLLPLMQKGAKGIDELTAAARKSGQVLSDDAIAKTRELDMSIAKMEAQLEGAAKAIMVELLPVAQDMADRMGAWIEENDEFLKQDLPEAFRGMADAVSYLSKIVEGTIGMFVDMRKAAGDAADALSDWDMRQRGIDTRRVQKRGTQGRMEVFRTRDLFGDPTAVLQGAQNRANFSGRAEAAEAARTAEAIASAERVIGLAEDLDRKRRLTESDAFHRAELSKDKKKGGGSRKSKKPTTFDGDPLTAIFGKSGAESIRGFGRDVEGEINFQIDESKFRSEQRDAELADTRAFEQTKAEIQLEERMRAQELLAANGADPLDLINQEETARIEFLETQKSLTEDKLELMRLEDEQAQVHHVANLKRIEQEKKAQQQRAAIITSVSNQVIDTTAAVGRVAIDAAMAEEGSIARKVANFAKGQSIEMGIVAATEGVRALVALATGNPVGAAAHGLAAAQAAGVAASLGGVFGIAKSKAGGGGSGGASSALGGFSLPGGSRGGSRGGGRSTPPPISRQGANSSAAGASGVVEGQAGNANGKGPGRTTVINLQQQALGFGSEQEVIAGVRRAIKRSEEETGTI